MINLNIAELPDCPCGKGKLLPVEDISPQGSQVYLKGWMCAHCNRSWLFSVGASSAHIQIKSIDPSLR